MLHKKFNQEDLATYFFKQKLIHVKEKDCLCFKLFKNFQRNAQNQSADALTAAKQKSRVDDSCHFQSLYSKRSQGQQLLFVYLCLPKRVFPV